MKLRLRLHRPQEIIWVLAILLVIVAVVLVLVPGILPGFSPVTAFWIAVVAAALMILGTWVF